MLYKRAQRYYRTRESPSFFIQPRNFGIEIYSPDGKSVMVKDVEKYKNIVERISAEANERFLFSKNCIFFGKNPEKPTRADDSFPELINDMSEIKEKAVRHIFLKEPHTISGLEEMCSELAPIIEQRIYGSYVQLRHLALPRTPICHLEEEASMKWHTDNHYRDTIKVMVYLDDVTEHTAPFTYLRHAVTHMPTKVSAAHPPTYPGSRVPGEIITKHLLCGYEIHRITGKKGTVILFDNDIIHKGVYGKTGYRTALIIEMEPSVRKIDYYIKEYSSRT